MIKIFKPMPIWLSCLLFGIPTILLILATRFLIPILNNQLGILPVLSWFLAGGICVFMPIFFAALIAHRLEGNEFNFSTICERLRYAPAFPSSSSISSQLVSCGQVPSRLPSQAAINLMRGDEVSVIDAESAAGIHHLVGRGG